MRRSGGGAARQQSSGRSTSCSREIDWIADEHGELRRPSKHFKDKEQKRTAECLPHKTYNSLKRRQTWSREEDDNLIRKVNLHGSKNWSTVACGITGRSPTQCRDRWMFYLDPAVSNQPWSEQEDIKLIQAHKTHGNKWCELAKLFPGRSGKAIKNHWSTLVRKQMKSDLVRRLPEQFPLVTKNKGSSTIKSGQYSSINIHVSPDMPVRPISEQGLAKNGRNESTLKGKYYDSTHGEGSVSHSVNVSGTGRSDSSCLGDKKGTSVAASFPGSLPKEESTNFLEVAPNREFSPAYDVCSSADPESLELHGSNIADLLDMSYCESLMIVPPDSPNDGHSTDRM